MTTRHGAVVSLVDTTLLRRAFGVFATGVTVVTVGGDSPHGMTANSFTSVSLDPPLVLVCVDRRAQMHERIRASGGFGVSVLSDTQEHAARHFADRRRPPGAAQLDAVDWRPGRLTGAPLVDDALARFECELWRSYDGGDHTIFVARLLSVELSVEGDALLFHRGRFRAAAPQRTELTA